MPDEFEPLTYTEKLMGLSARLMDSGCCPVCNGFAFAHSPFGWCPRAKERGHGRPYPRELWAQKDGQSGGEKSKSGRD